MKPISIVRMENRIDDLFKKADTMTDLEMKAHWARYLCIIISGYLEESIREALSLYTQGTSHNRVASHVETSLERFQNPNLEKSLQLIGSFDKDWRESINSSLRTETKTAINSINNLRNSIAHGGTANVSFINILSYYHEAKFFIDRICSTVRS